MTISGRREFGDNALKLVIGAGLEERLSVSSQLFTEQEWVLTRDKLF